MINILFLCIENSNRSQMAVAFARKFAPDNIAVYSAGPRPGGKINERVIQFMAELGLT